jgi:hypothetical protein
MPVHSILPNIVLIHKGTNIFHLLTPKIDRYLQANPKGYHPFQAIESNSGPRASVRGGNGPLSANPGEDMHTSSDDEDSEDDEEMTTWPTPSPPGFEDPAKYTTTYIDDMLVLMSTKSRAKSSSRLVRLKVSCSHLCVTSKMFHERLFY